MPISIDGEPTDLWQTVFGDCDLVNRKDIPKYIPEEYRKINLDYKDKDEKTVLSLVREFADDNMTMHYLVNPNNEEIDFTATVKGKSGCVFNAVTGETEPLCFENKGEEIIFSNRLEKRGSTVIFVYGDEREKSAEKTNNELKPLDLKGKWDILETDDNALTLDYCDLYIDGELKNKNLPVSDVQEIACAYEKKVKVDVVFNFDVRDDGFENCKLVVETPEIFDITVNGAIIDKTDLGFYNDPAFRILDIRKAVKSGNNEIKLSCDFLQSEDVYQNMKNSLIFESEKNKLTYDMEIEAVYIIGDFGVKTDKPFEKSERRALITDGGFYITSAPKTVYDGNIAEQGYPFFAGSMTFKKQIDLKAEEISNRSVCFSELCSTVTEVKVNGKNAGKVIWEPYFVDLNGLLKEGINEIEITVTGNLRNLLGPFHLIEGETYAVSPPQFFHYSPIWAYGENKNWVDTYCFVEFGLFF